MKLSVTSRFAPQKLFSVRYMLANHNVVFDFLQTNKWTVPLSKSLLAAFKVADTGCLAADGDVIFVSSDKSFSKTVYSHLRRCVSCKTERNQEGSLVALQGE